MEVEADHLPLQNLARLSDKSNCVQRWVEFLDAYTFTIQHRSKNANADVLSRLPLPAIAEDPQLRYRLTDPSDLDVYFVGASEIHPPSLQTSLDSLSGLAKALGGLAYALGGLTATPDDVVSWGEGWSSIERIMFRWQNGRKRGQPGKGVCAARAQAQLQLKTLPRHVLT